jgi:hypothetical protein
MLRTNMMWLLDGSDLDRADHLTALLQRWRLEARALASVLAEAQAEMEHWQRETWLLRLSDKTPEPSVLQRCAMLQCYCDELATELTHVRLALAGAEDERRRHGIEQLARPA